jgi:hypothetical protein
MPLKTLLSLQQLPPVAGCFYSQCRQSCEIINGNMVHITGLGTCTITATQDGNQNYNPAPQ